LANVTVFGMGPLPWETADKHFGLGTRTWHFTLPLLEAGHQVFLVVKGMFDAYSEPKEREPYEPDFQNLTIKSLNVDSFHDSSVLQDLLEESESDCVVAVNMEAASVVCRLDPPVPIWADLNGYSMGEAQARQNVVGDQDDPFIMWMQLLPVLMRADVFSAVSAAQRHALLVELGSIGIPNAVEPPPESSPENRLLEPLSGSDDPFWVAWSGGFNTWADPRTLVRGLEAAMDNAPSVRFVSSGGAIGGHDPVTYKKFEKSVEGSPFNDRFHLLGWVSSESLSALYREAHLGLNVDRSCYETEFGARNRLNTMMRFGLPILTTYGTEISRIIEDHRLGLVVNCGDHKALASAIIWASENREKVESMGARAQRFALEKFTFSSTTRRIQAWVDLPVFAPDNLRKRAGGERWNSELERRLSLLARIPELESAEAELNRIHGTRSFAFYRRMRKLLSRW